MRGHMGWERPIQGFFKVNCDGAVNQEDGKARAGGLLRDDQGRSVWGVVANLGECPPLTAGL
ncbi:hypothetical protein Scep_009738 [Stephania cephalantha]|uniref:RNase H type-1 domain-containing protein n=1 Tax=Stephania cephalantha TaxID=152367 RepID=A0AAP0JW77_9MAGN